MSRLKLKKGDKKEPKGEVGVYVKYTPSEDQTDHGDFFPGYFYTMFFSVYQETVMDHSESSYDEIDDIIENADISDDYVNPDKGNGIRSPYYALVGRSFDSEQDVLKEFQRWDIVFSGNVSVPEDVYESLVSSAAKYFNKFFNRIEKEQAMYETQGIAFYVVNKYITPLIKANILGMPKRFQRIKRDFHGFAGREDIPANDVNEFCAVIESGNTNPELIKAYAIKMEAIAVQQYDRAVEMDGKINCILGLNRTNRKTG